MQNKPQDEDRRLKWECFARAFLSRFLRTDTIKIKVFMDVNTVTSPGLPAVSDSPTASIDVITIVNGVVDATHLARSTDPCMKVVAENLQATRDLGSLP